MGGGIIDLMLIEVVEEEGDFELVCCVVGNYLFVGGDNMDMVLVYVVVEGLSDKGVILDFW